MSTHWASVYVTWLDGHIETYQVGGYARRREAIQVENGALHLWMGKSPYSEPEHVASIPLGGLRHWKVQERQ